MLSELEEVIQYKNLSREGENENKDRKMVIQRLWEQRYVARTTA